MSKKPFLCISLNPREVHDLSDETHKTSEAVKARVHQYIVSILFPLCSHKTE